jgi:hypothetical protein
MSHLGSKVFHDRERRSGSVGRLFTPSCKYSDFTERDSSDSSPRPPRDAPTGSFTSLR